MTIQVTVDGVVDGTCLANTPRPELPVKTGAPNPEHGFVYTLAGSAATTLASAGEHRYGGVRDGIDHDSCVCVQALPIMRRG